MRDHNLFTQLKPALRFSLVKELFPDFFREFSHMFEYEGSDLGSEFMSMFVTSLKCRCFIADQVIV